MKSFYVLTILLFTAACTKVTVSNKESVFMVFRPRACEKVMIVPCKLSPVDNGGRKAVTLGRNGVKPLEYLLVFMTGGNAIDTARKYFKYDGVGASPYSMTIDIWEGSDLDPTLSPPNPALEAQLELDYKEYLKSFNPTRSVGISKNETLARAAVQPWPYRTTGIKNMSITALTPLFGKPAGTPLNPYFTIYDFDPRQIISYTTQQLVWGYNDKTKIESIDQWLSLKPMAPPMMMLHLNTMPTEVPGTCKFVVALETEAGAVIRDTTSVTFLAN